MKTLAMKARQFQILADILADYLAMVGNDPDRKQRVITAGKLLAQMRLGQ
jgi:hypothetical protein